MTTKRKVVSKLTKEKVKQLVAAVAVAGIIGVGYTANVMTDMQRQITELQENSAKLSQENINLVVERDNLKQLTGVQKKELEKLQGKLEENVNPVSETVSTVDSITEEVVTPVSYDGIGTYLGLWESTFYNDFGLCADGTSAGPQCIAVDPSVIPLGSTVYLEFENCPELNGFYGAHDTGGAITGSGIIDTWFGGDCYAYGRQPVHVYLVE